MIATRMGEDLAPTLSTCEFSLKFYLLSFCRLMRGQNSLSWCLIDLRKSRKGKIDAGNVTGRAKGKVHLFRCVIFLFLLPMICVKSQKLQLGKAFWAC